DSPNRQYVSPSANVCSSTWPSSQPRCPVMRPASSGCERPDTTMSRFCGARSIQCICVGSVTTARSSPGSAISVAVRLSMLLVDPPFLCLLPLGEPGERSRRDIIRDDRTRRNPSIVANVDRSIERIVDTGPDVPADPSPPLGLAGLVLEVRGDVAGRDVRVLADLGVPDVGEVRHLRPGADLGVLHLDERADLRPRADLGAGPDVREGADLGPGRDPDRAAENAVRMDRRVRLDLDVGVDPRR